MTVKSHQITGVGPQREDGSVDLFTVLPQPFTVTKEWLDTQGKYPAVGDSLMETADGLELAYEPEKAAADEFDAQKKTDGSGASGDGSEVSPYDEPTEADAAANGFIYVANPIEVTALRIVDAGAVDEAGGVALALENGENVYADAGMVSRMTPVAGDYWVVQADGYTYLNPKDVFERKYALKTTKEQA